MASTRKRLEELTADLRLPDERVNHSTEPAPSPGATQRLPPSAGNHSDEVRFPPARAAGSAPRTGPGQMLAFRGQMREVEGELSDLRDKLRRFDGAMPSKRIDPALVHPSRWANRHEASFETAAFAGLKNDIEKAGGNVQPILVRPMSERPEHFELVFGHRRHRACLELGIPVLACIWEGELNDSELFAAMDRENRERADLSPYEQGIMYQRALEEQLFPAQRRLAEYLGVSHTWVRKAILVAQLPPAIVECFRSPLEITHRHAERLTAALETDRRGVLKRAEKVRGQGASANAVVDSLIASAGSGHGAGRVELRLGEVRFGHAAVGKDGAVTVKLAPQALAASARPALLELLDKALNGLSGPSARSTS